MNNAIPGIDIEYDMESNPSVSSPNAPYAIYFRQTEDTLIDVELYKAFIDNAISQFRHSRTYKNYKAYLMDLGMTRCQILGNIDSAQDMATVEMHHNFLTIFDIAILITEHTIKTTGYITTFDLVHLLKQEHKNNRIPIVMLSKTVHQLYHSNEDFIIPAQYCFGYWQDLLVRYNKGITKEIAYKCLNFIQKSMEIEQIGGNTFANNVLELRENIKDWSGMNDEYQNTYPISGVAYDYPTTASYSSNYYY